MPAKLLPLPHAQQTSGYDSATTELVCRLSSKAAMRVAEGQASMDDLFIGQRSWAPSAQAANAAIEATITYAALRLMYASCSAFVACTWLHPHYHEVLR